MKGTLFDFLFLFVVWKAIHTYDNIYTVRHFCNFQVFTVYH